MSVLLPLPEQKQFRVLCGTAVRKPLPVLQAYLRSLDRQELPPGTVLTFCFVEDFPDKRDPALAFLKEWVAQHPGSVLLSGGPTATDDFTDQHGVTHQWAPSAMKRVGRLKNRLLQKAADERYDAVFLADADLILDTTTLASLIAADVPIACGVYWTHWQRSPSPEVTVHAGPQVWLQHPYQLSGRGMDEAEFRRLLIDRQLVQVWGQGACTLIRTDVIRAGVSFSPFPGVAEVGLMAGEDRHFCLHAESRHIPMWADGWVDVFHQYHLPEDIAEGETWEQRLAAPHPERATTGDLFSATLTALEGVPQPDGRWTTVPPQKVRGRLGAVPMLPELEEALHEMRRGESRIVPVHFPVSHPIPQFRGTRRLVRVTLHDVKPYCVAPVIQKELYVGPRSGAYADGVTLTPAQHDGIIAEATNG